MPENSINSQLQRATQANLAQGQVRSAPRALAAQRMEVIQPQPITSIPAPQVLGAQSFGQVVGPHELAAMNQIAMNRMAGLQAGESFDWRDIFEGDRTGPRGAEVLGGPPPQLPPPPCPCKGSLVVNWPASNKIPWGGLSIEVVPGMDCDRTCVIHLVVTRIVSNQVLTADLISTYDPNKPSHTFKRVAESLEKGKRVKLTAFVTCGDDRLCDTSGTEELISEATFEAEGKS